MRDYWVGKEEAAQALQEAAAESSEAIAKEQPFANESLSPTDPLPMPIERGRAGLGIGINTTIQHPPSRSQSRRPSLTSPIDGLTQTASLTGHPTGASTFASYYPPYNNQKTALSPRNRERLVTAKSAILIYCALLGLSPILKSLTESTSPDSIWAMSSWLIIINIFTFDYGAGVEAK